MTIELNGMDVVEIVQAVTLGGGVLLTLLVVLAVYLLVRPPRQRAEEAPEPELDADEMRQLIDRMDRRLASLEGILADRRRHPVRAEAGETDLIGSGTESRDARRMK